MARILIPLPARDFDPTEAAIPWRVLTQAGHSVRFATPDGRLAEADPRVRFGTGFGPWKPLLMADATARDAYDAMAASDAFRAPRTYADADFDDCDGLLFPGGHAPGMRPYLESTLLQQLASDAFARDLPVGAICHGVLVLARARREDGRPLLHGRRSTALLALQELGAWALTAVWLGSYYRTYAQTVQAEVTSVLARPQDFVRGPLPLLRDSPTHLQRGFALRDGNYVSARWPGDAHSFAQAFLAMLDANAAKIASTPSGNPNDAA